MNLFGNLINGIISNAADSVGDAIGDVVGNAVGKVANQASDNMVNEMKRENEIRDMQVEEQRKITELPSHCPHCKAPTNGQLVCEYCNSKIM